MIKDLEDLKLKLDSVEKSKFNVKIPKPKDGKDGVGIKGDKGDPGIGEKGPRGNSIYKAFEYLFHVPYEDEPKVRLELVGVSNIDSPSDNTGDIDLLGLNDNIENI